MNASMKHGSFPAIITVGDQTFPVTVNILSVNLDVEASITLPYETAEFGNNEAAVGEAEAPEVEATEAASTATTTVLPTPEEMKPVAADPIQRIRDEVAAIRNIADADAMDALAGRVTGGYTLAQGRRVADQVLRAVENNLHHGTATIRPYVTNVNSFLTQVAPGLTGNDRSVAEYIHGRILAAFNG